MPDTPYPAIPAPSERSPNQATLRALIECVELLTGQRLTRDGSTDSRDLQARLQAIEARLAALESP